jgi:hypothetical protein
MLNEDSCFIRKDVGEQLLGTTVEVESSADPVETTGATQEKIERDALILKFSKLIAEYLMKQDHPNEALTRVIDGRLLDVFSVVDRIVLEEDARMLPGPMFVGPIY